MTLFEIVFLILLGLLVICAILALFLLAGLVQLQMNNRVIDAGEQIKSQFRTTLVNYSTMKAYDKVESAITSFTKTIFNKLKDITFNVAITGDEETDKIKGDEGK